MTSRLIIKDLPKIVFNQKKNSMQQQQPPSNSTIQHFELEQFDQWYPSLLANGCVVLKNILTKQQVTKAQDAFWEWLENIGSGIKRADPSTWKNQNWPGLNDMGFFVSYGGCHTWASWMVRTHPKVKQAFAKIWNTQKLITSLDTIISWRPWWNPVSKGDWDPYVENLHLDQNPFYKKGLKCVQGMMPLKRVRKNEVGGLQVVSKSNSEQVLSQIIKRYPQVEHSTSDWLELRGNDPLMGKRELVECDAGDLVLWDSRTVHGGKLNFNLSEDFKKEKQNELVRIAVTVSMVPREWCSEGVLQLRKSYFQKKIGTTHWPQQANKNTMGKTIKGLNKEAMTYKFPELTPQIEDVL